MTLDEKIELIGGTGVATKEIKPLGIPELRMTDGPAGVRLDTNKSMAFPAPIAMAATWDTALINKVGSGIARETKGHARHVILGPCVNIARLPLGGRVFEAYGEDPFLTSRMAVSFIEGVQKEGVAATVKHFAANNEEIDRMYVDVMVSRRALNEIYFPAFKAAVQEAGVLCVMGAYNKVNGVYCCENDYLLKEVLRNEWKFKGMIMSDWWATHSAIPTAIGGLDIEMPFGDFMNIKNLEEPIEKGIVPIETINEKVRHILTLIFKLGLFDKPVTVENKSLINSPENRKIAYETSLESIVLLKNYKNILPLDKTKIKTIAVIGPNADDPITGGGGSSKVYDISPVTLLQGLKNKLPIAKIVFAKGLVIDNSTNINPIESKYLFTDKNGRQHGLKAEFFNSMDLVGVPVLKRIDKEVNFTWDTMGPGFGVAKDHYSIRWSGYLKVDKTGDYILAVVGDDGMRLWLNNKLIEDAWYPHAAMKRSTSVSLKKGQYYKITFELFEKTGGAVGILGWGANRDSGYKKAVEIAKNADYVILSVGNTSDYETEGRDRPDLFLPDGQDKLIEKVAAVNKNVIVVLTAGSPVVMDEWIDKVKGVVDAWFPGTEGGNAIADILLGNADPSGKLPITFPHKLEDCSAYPTYNRLKGRTYYSDDIYVGYRHFDKYNINPLFPFGFGLSYTKFEYSDINIVRNGEEYEVTFYVKNKGKVKGKETAQLYISSTAQNIDRPVKELKGFCKVSLNPGEQKKLTIKLKKEAFAYFSEQYNKWEVDPGIYKVLVGVSSRDIKLRSEIVLN
jgi:beta-glucosidase